MNERIDSHVNQKISKLLYRDYATTFISNSIRRQYIRHTHVYETMPHTLYAFIET